MYSGRAAALTIVIVRRTSASCVYGSFGGRAHAAHERRAANDRRGDQIEGREARGERVESDEVARLDGRGVRARARDGAQGGAELACREERRDDVPHDHDDGDPDRDREAPQKDARVEEQEPRGEGDHERLGRRADGELDQDQPRDEAPRASHGMLLLRAARMLAEFLVCCLSYQSGRRTRNVEPRPSSLSTWIVPPCMSTRRRAIARPRPVPRRFARSSPACLYSSKIIARSAGEIPGPVSLTADRRVAPLLAHDDDDLPLVRELDRVADEVGQDLPHAPGVGVGDHAGLPLHAERDRLAAEKHLRLADHLVREDGEVDLRARELELSALDRAELEDVVDELEEVRAGAADLLDLLARVRREWAVDLGDQDVGEAEDGVERAPELVAHGGQERGALAIRGRRAREVVAVGPLGHGEPPDERVEAPGEHADLVERPYRHGLAGRLRPRPHHPADALGEEDDLLVRVARHGVRDARRDADEERRQRDERRDERRPPFRCRRLAHERDDTLELVRREERVDGEARPSERRERLAVAELRHPEERPSVGSAEARVEEHFAVVPHEQELRPRASRRELERVEALGPPGDGAGRRKTREAHRHRRRERVGVGRRALVAGSRERVEPDNADPDGDREPDDEHDQRR